MNIYNIKGDVDYTQYTTLFSILLLNNIISFHDNKDNTPLYFDVFIFTFNPICLFISVYFSYPMLHGDFFA